MGIDLQLHDGRPHRPGRRSQRKPTLIRESHEHGEALTRLIDRLPAGTPGRLAALDPYRDTVFDEGEARAALSEIPALLDHCATDAETAAVRDLAVRLEDCATTPGRHLVFVGD